MLIGLTGGIGSGKTLVANFLKEFGAIVIDTDEIAREIVNPGEEAYFEIVETFGKDILLPNKEIDRKKLGEMIFSSEDARQKLNAICHPRIMKEVAKRVSQYSPNDIIFLVVPLLIEEKMQSFVDKIWLVKADKEIQLERILKRDNLTPQEAQARINSQMPTQEKEKFADVIIDNNGSFDNTKKQVEYLFKKLIEEIRR